jgi:hypothetical protein
MSILNRLFRKDKIKNQSSTPQSDPPDLLKYWISTSKVVQDVVSSMGRLDGTTTMKSNNRQFFGKIHSIAEGNVVAFIILTRATQIMEEFNSAGNPLEAMSRAINFLDGMPSYEDIVSKWRHLLANLRGLPMDELLYQSRQLHHELVDSAKFFYTSANSLRKNN